MVSTVERAGENQLNQGQDSGRKKRYPSAFSKYKFYLDIKASKIRTNLIEDISALGGILVEFLTKEVTHVISEGPEWKFLLVSNGTCGPPSPWTPGATPSPATSTSLDSERTKKVKSRVDGILGASRAPEKNLGSSDVLEIAKRFHCNIWSLNKTLSWLTKFKAKYGSLGSGGGKTEIKRKERGLQNPYIKLDSAIRYARPAFAEFKNWPRISFDGWAGSSPYSEQKKKIKRKNLINRLELLINKEEVNPKKRDCAKKKEGGFCEICNKSFSELEAHLRGESHTQFVRDSGNWSQVDSRADTRHQAARDILF